jgi:hypothetical protein
MASRQRLAQVAGLVLALALALALAVLAAVLAAALVVKARRTALVLVLAG